MLPVLDDLLGQRMEFGQVAEHVCALRGQVFFDMRNTGIQSERADQRETHDEQPDGRWTIQAYEPS